MEVETDVGFLVGAFRAKVKGLDSRLVNAERPVAIGSGGMYPERGILGRSSLTR